MPICRQAVQLTYCYEWNTSSVRLQKEEVPGARLTAIKLLAKLSKRVVPSEAGCPLSLLWLLPFLSFSLPHHASCRLSPPSFSSPCSFSYPGKGKGHLLLFSLACLLEWEALVGEKWAGFWEFAEASIYLSRAKEGWGWGRPCWPPQMNIKPFHTLLSHCEVWFSTLHPLKLFLDFTLKGQRNQQGGATEPWFKSWSVHTTGALSSVPVLGGCPFFARMSWFMAMGVANLGLTLSSYFHDRSSLATAQRGR